MLRASQNVTCRREDGIVKTETDRKLKRRGGERERESGTR